MSNVISIGSDKQQQLLFLVHSGKDNSKGVKELAQFLMNYLDEVDLGLLDKNGMNVWHYVCKLGKVRMLKLLLNVTDPNDWEKYFDMPAQLPDKPKCIHLAASHNQVGMVEQLKQMSQDEEYKHIIRMSSPNESGHTLLSIAINNNSYKMIKVLYDRDTQYNSKQASEMVRIVLTSKEGIHLLIVV